MGVKKEITFLWYSWDYTAYGFLRNLSSSCKFVLLRHKYIDEIRYESLNRDKLGTIYDEVEF